MTATGHRSTDPVRCEEFAYGLGRPDGILVLRYSAAGVLEFGGLRQDFLHQLYFSPDGVLSFRLGSRMGFTGPGEAFWAERTLTHEVRAGDRGTVYRVCLREMPGGLTGLRVGVVSVDPEAARLLTGVIARADCSDQEALAARRRFLGGLAASPAAEEHTAGHAKGTGAALAVARELARNPADPTELREWALRLHLSVKSLQRDFVREYGVSFTRQRTVLRLRTARILLGDQSVTRVARLVGYASASAFVAAFTKEYGYTPGRHADRVAGRQAVSAAAQEPEP